MGWVFAWELCDSATTDGAKIRKNYLCQSDSGGSKRASGWYYSLTSRAGKKVLALYPAPPFSLIFPEFFTPLSLKIGNCAVERS